jgi:hypothetical protein
MTETSNPPGREWYDAAIDGGLAGDAAVALVALHDRFHTPIALRSTAAKLHGVPAAQIPAAVKALAENDDLVRQCVKKPAPSAQEQRADLTHFDGKPRLPAFDSLPVPTLQTIPQRAAGYAEQNAAAQSNYGVNSIGALRRTQKQ